MFQRDESQFGGDTCFEKLKEIGNTIIIVEHDKAIIEASDFVVDIGPNAGEKGGYIVYKGKQKDLIKTNTWTSKQFIIDSKKLLNKIVLKTNLI